MWTLWRAMSCRPGLYSWHHSILWESSQLVGASTFVPSPDLHRLGKQRRPRTSSSCKLSQLHPARQQPSPGRAVLGYPGVSPSSQRSKDYDGDGGGAKSRGECGKGKELAMVLVTKFGVPYQFARSQFLGKITWDRKSWWMDGRYMYFWILHRCPAR